VEAIKVVAELGEGVTQGGAHLQDERFIGVQFAIWEEGDGVIHLIKLLHNPNQGQVVTTHQVRLHGWGIRNHQIKVKEVVARVWAIPVGLAGGLRCQWGRGGGLGGWRGWDGKGDQGRGINQHQFGRRGEGGCQWRGGRC